MSRAIVSVATGRYVKGLDRLTEWCAANGEDYITWRDRLPEGSPTHQDIPYGFKAYALTAALGKAGGTASTLLWCDASIIPVKPLAELWERIEQKGYWIANNGWTNYEWTADSAYPDLFPEMTSLGAARVINVTIPHVVATCFGISLAHPTGRAILEEYYRLASTTKAFCGPWVNYDYEKKHGFAQPEGRVAVCGPPDVRGHRHDQTALSVIAWRLGLELTNCPYILAYKREGQPVDPGTIVLMDGIC